VLVVWLKEGRMFFFEKKEPKNFYLLVSAQAGSAVRQVASAQEQKFFASFFQKRSSSFLTAIAHP
jgi:hypothetical protein